MPSAFNNGTYKAQCVPLAFFQGQGEVQAGTTLDNDDWRTTG